jgi:Rap1a immunity proteins
MLRRILTGLTIYSALTASALGASATPKISTGNDLLRVCETPASDPNGPEEQLHCTLFVGDIFFGRAWRETVSIEDAQGNKCLPEGVNVRQLKDISVKYLRENPQVRHESAASLVMMSVLKAFPNCKVRWLKLSDPPQDKSIF